MRLTLKPARFSARKTALPFTTGSRPPAMLGGHGHAANFRVSISWYGKTLIAAVGNNGADGFLDVGESFLLGIAFGHHFGERRDQYREAAVLLRLKHD
jgi:hypothetical protein